MVLANPSVYGGPQCSDDFYIAITTVRAPCGRFGRVRLFKNSQDLRQELHEGGNIEGQFNPFEASFKCHCTICFQEFVRLPHQQAKLGDG